MGTDRESPEATRVATRRSGEISDEQTSARRCRPTYHDSDIEPNLTTSAFADFYLRVIPQHLPTAFSHVIPIHIATHMDTTSRSIEKS